MDPDEFDALMATLSPDEQDALLAELGMGGGAAPTMGGLGGGYDPYAFGTPVAPQYAAPAPMSYNTEPELSPNELDLALFNQIPPELSSRGRVEPFGLDEASQAYNVMQDLADVSVDRAVAMYGGPGAFSAGAFDPVTVPVGDPLDLEGARYVDMMAQGDTGGYEWYLAKSIQGGLNPSDAIASMWNFVNTPSEDPQMETARQTVIASLPPNLSTSPTVRTPQMQQQVGDFTTPEGRAASVDQQVIMERANDMFERLASDPVVGYTDPETGMKFVGAQQMPSEATQWFQERNIPTPAESYLDERWLNAPLSEKTVTERAQREEVGDRRLKMARDINKQTRQNLRAMEQAWKESEDERAAAAAGPQRTGPAENPYELTPGSLQAAQTAADLDFANLRESGTAPTLESFRTRSRAGLGLPPVQARGRVGGDLSGLSDIYAGKPEGLEGMSEQQAQASYDQAYQQWEDENRNRLLDEAMRRGAVANQGTGNPFVISSNGRVLDTYNFAGTEDEQEAVGRLMGVVAQLGGNENVRIGPMNQGFLESYRSAPEAARHQRFQAYNTRQDLYNQTAPDEIARAQAIGRALAMSQAGRTPMNDVLMQRSLGRSALIGYP